MSAERALRRAAEAGDQAAMAQLEQLLSASGQRAEATYWRGRRADARWADRAVVLGGGRYPGLVLLGVVLVGVLGLLTAALTVRLVLWTIEEAGDGMSAGLLLFAAVLSGVLTFASWSSAVGMLRGSPRSASQGASAVRCLGCLATFGALFVMGAALLKGPHAARGMVLLR